MGAECVGERSWIVVDGANGVGDDLRHCSGVFFVVEEVGSAVATIKPGQFVIGSFFASDNIFELFSFNATRRRPPGWSLCPRPCLPTVEMTNQDPFPPLR